MSEHIIETEVWAGTPFVPIGGTGKLREEIVRCRDCRYCRKHNMRAYGGYRDQLLCHHFSMSSGAGWPVEPDGFCAWGERRDA